MASLETSDAASLASLIRHRRQGRDLLVLLDYDGTLVPLVEDPDRAAPDPELQTLLTALAATPGFEVHVVSGRTRATLERWLGTLPVGLHAEHGAYSRASGDTRWVARVGASLSGFDAVRSVIAPYMADGTRIEEKELGLTWHYRALDLDVGTKLAMSLARELEALLGGSDFMVVHGSRVLEVRPRAVTKRHLVAALSADAPSARMQVAIGDDRTDEDMFEALGDDDVAIHVGAGSSRAAWRIADVATVRELLAQLVSA